MGVSHREGKDVLADEGEDLLEGTALLGHRPLEEGGARPDLSEDGPLVEALAMRCHRVGRERAEPQELLRGKVEVGAGVYL